jgi:hypothetical protein
MTEKLGFYREHKSNVTGGVKLLFFRRFENTCFSVFSGSIASAICGTSILTISCRNEENTDEE